MSPAPAHRPKVGKIVDAPRRAAFDVLVSVEVRDAYANLLLPEVLRERDITGRDAAFATELLYGTLRAQGFLDAVIAVCSDRRLAEIEPRTLAMLRLGAYQLLFTRVPAHAAVSATVGVARVALTDGPSRFVNAVLRRVSERELEAWREQVTPPRESDPVAHLAVATSHPEWIVRAYADALGGLGASLADDATFESVRAALEANNERPMVQLVALPGRSERDELAKEVGGEPGRLSPFAVQLPGGAPGELAALREGRARVQDEGSQLAALALGDAPLAGTDARWLDLCAGPGGKAALLAALAEQRGARLTAVELAEHRARLVEQALTGFAATVLVGDGRKVGELEGLEEGAFDRVLIDAPCTGLGALRRRAEARWRKGPGDIPALTALQRELVAAGARALRPGGVLAYVTCSPHIAETRAVVADAVRRLRLEPLPFAAEYPVAPRGRDEAQRQLWPHLDATDGMFIALLRKPLSEGAG